MLQEIISLLQYRTVADLDKVFAFGAKMAAANLGPNLAAHIDAVCNYCKLLLSSLYWFVVITA